MLEPIVTNKKSVGGGTKNSSVRIKTHVELILKPRILH